MSRRRRGRAARRVERDGLGSVAVPRRALWGAFTERARRTFQISGRPPHPALVRAYAQIKQAAARVNARLGLLPPRWAAAIASAAARVAAGHVPDAAAIDVLQAGAGTPAHMTSTRSWPTSPTSVSAAAAAATCRSIPTATSTSASRPTTSRPRQSA